MCVTGSQEIFMALKLEDKKTFVKEINAVAGESISAVMSSTMGPGISIDRASIDG